MRKVLLVALLLFVCAQSDAQIRVAVPECPITGHSTCANNIDDDMNGVVDDAPGTAAFVADADDYSAEFEDGKTTTGLPIFADGSASGGQVLRINPASAYGAGQVALCLPSGATSGDYQLSLTAKIPNVTNNVVWVSMTPFSNLIDNDTGSVLFNNQPIVGFEASWILDGVDFRNKSQARSLRTFTLVANDCLYVTAMPGILLDVARLVPIAEVVPVLTSPLVASVTETTATFTANTSEPGTCQVHYGTASGVYGSTSSTAASSAGVCTINLSSLTGSTTYYAVMRVTHANGNIGTSAEVSFTTLFAAPPPETGCTHYAGPTVSGSANGSSAANRFLIASFWAVAAPGDVLCLADGTYQGASSMIRPPTGFNATSANRITIKAINDGGPFIDGQQVRNPVYLQDNDYFIVEGIDARNGYPDAVVRLATGADNNIIRRVCAWDVWPLNGNTSVFASNGNTGNLWEDICFFGIARKGFEASQGSNNGVIRRAWGRWERNTRTGPKMTFTMGYNSRTNIFENVIGTWSEVGTAVERYGIFAMDGTTDSNGVCYNSKILGSIAYLKASDTAATWLGGLFGSRSIDCFEFRHVVSYIEPGSHTALRPILAQRYDGGGSTPTAGNPATVTPGNRKFTNVTEIGGAASSIDSSWTKTNHVDAANVAGAPNIWVGSGSGARVCKRYVNGTLTGDPLWPWPMNERIKQAHVRAGRTAVDVTADMQKIFGTIPAECRA